MSANLTKKQQKLAAFRNKQKAKKAGAEAPPDLPEEDIVAADDDDVVDAVVVSQSSSSKPQPQPQPKKKDVAAEAEDQGDKVDGGESVKKDKGKKKKTAWDDDEEDGDDAGKKKSKKDIKQRFILFVGNLSFKTTKEEVQKHFEPAIGHLPAVRLLTTKPTPQAPVPKSRGIAFLELPTSTSMQAALKLHHSNLKGRTINVELTAGGGGAGESRKRKIEERNKRVGDQREKRAEREKEEGGGQGAGAGAGEGEGADGDQGEGEGEGKVKTRGGRRVKKKTAPTDGSAPPSKRARPDHSGETISGWGSRQPGVPQPQLRTYASRSERFGGGGRGDQHGRSSSSSNRGGDSGGGRDKFQRKKWQPTGANALTVG
ncbi:nucleolar protein 6 [Kwoniella heveanensis BCC8398]|uniref:Nucleolar protein 12 n=1 Tax=Kwoniella heveanensis BCC8398 TaxID=1296120 RepID=A0A1B9GR08_9TREE|nr:nucleolar protein 6 [Kwoniella heveanensis BCC8398]